VSVLSQPFLKVSERRSTGLDQGARGEPPHPAIADSKGFGDGAMLSCTILYGLSCPFDAFFYAHWC
jgi:hypothetical protein